ncbi:hypothetical protein Q9L58_005502 [Maublancomyces gigas]|uniref:Uncharacterized protein n=1 Tax=Discina gigas TaxID=1032678 RepID=A0ABR3GI22_9PEZI
MQRKWDFLHAIVECQIGPVKIDYVKLAHVLGYKNERCAQDSYHRFRREHFPRDQRGALGRGRLPTQSKQQFYADGRAIRNGGSSLYRDDDEEGPYDYTNDNDDDDDDDDGDEDDDKEDKEEDDKRRVKIEDRDRAMEKAAEQFWSLGFINLEEDSEEEKKVKTEPVVKKERVVEKWVWA